MITFLMYVHILYRYLYLGGYKWSKAAMTINIDAKGETHKFALTSLNQQCFHSFS